MCPLYDSEAKRKMFSTEILSQESGCAGAEPNAKAREQAEPLRDKTYPSKAAQTEREDAALAAATD